MKKILSLFFALFFCLTLAACDEYKMGNNAGGTVNGGMSKAESGEGGVISGTESTLDGTPQSSSGNTSDGMTITAKISAKDATAAALDHAGLEENQVTDVEVDLDRDNGRLIYEIDFNSNGIEYDYDIDARTGDIISADRDRD